MISRTPRTLLGQPSRTHLIVEGLSVAVDRPRAIVHRHEGELALATATGEGEPGAAARDQLLDGLDLPIVAVPGCPAVVNLHHSPQRHGGLSRERTARGLKT